MQFVETGKFFQNSAGPDHRNAKQAIARVIPKATETLQNTLDQIEIEIVSPLSKLTASIWTMFPWILLILA